MCHSLVEDAQTFNVVSVCVLRGEDTRETSRLGTTLRVR